MKTRTIKSLLKKRLLRTNAMFLALVMLFSVMSVTAFAADDGTIYDFTLYYNADDGKMYSDASHETEVSDVEGWSGDGYTLTLSGIQFKTTAPIALHVPDGTEIISEKKTESEIATLYQKANDDDGSVMVTALYVDGVNLTMTMNATGKLVLTAGTSDSNLGCDDVSCGIALIGDGDAGGVFKLDSVIATACDAGSSYGIYAPDSYIEVGGGVDCIFTAGDALASDGYSVGVLCDGYSHDGYSSRDVETHSGDGYITAGLYVDNRGMYIESGYLTATCGEGEYAYGVYSDEFIAVRQAGSLSACTTNKTDYAIYSEDDEISVEDGFRVTGASERFVSGTKHLIQSGDAPVTIAPDDREPISFVNLAMENKTYDGQPATWTGTLNSVDSDGNDTNLSESDYEIIWSTLSDSELTAPPTDCGVYKFKISVDYYNEQYTGSREFVFAIMEEGISEYGLYYSNGKLYSDETYETEVTDLDGWSGNGDTLTLNGFNFETIYPTALHVPDGTTIHVADGSVNTIKSLHSPDYDEIIEGDAVGLLVDGYDLTISGNGTLNVYAGSGKVDSYGVKFNYERGSSTENGTMFIDGATLNIAAVGGYYNSYGVYAPQTAVKIGKNSAAEIHCTSGVTAYNWEGWGSSYGIKCSSFEQSSGMTNSESSMAVGSSFGIYCNGPFSLASGTVVVHSNVGAALFRTPGNALYAGEKIEISGGELTASLAENEVRKNNIVEAVGGLYLSDYPSLTGASESYSEGMTGLYGESGEITITIVDSFPVNLSGITVESKTYDGEPAAYSGTLEAVLESGDSVDEETLENVVYAWSTSNGDILDAAPQDAGSYVLTISVSGKYTGSVEIPFSIEKKTVTIAPASLSMTAGGTIPSFTLSYDGLVDGDVLTPTAEPAFSLVDQEGNAGVDGRTAGTYFIRWTNMDEISFTTDGEQMDNYEIQKSPDATLTVSSAQSNPSSGSSGSSSSSTTETVKNADGSTTTTKTAADGTVTVTTKTTDGTVGTVVCDDDGVISSVNASISKEAAESGNVIVLPVEIAVSNSSEEAIPVVVGIPANANSVKVEIPVSNVTPGAVAVIVHDDGTEEIVNTSVVTDNGVVLLLEEDSTVKIIDNSKVFEDVEGHWAEDAIAFVSSRELFYGTSETTFSPNNTMTRAMLMVVLARFDGYDTTVDDGEVWYAAGMEWAIENGVSDGSNPDGNITREQLVTMLWRYAGSPESSYDMNGYSDSSSVSGYADEAMRWAIENGIVAGTSSNTLSPCADSTRAQLATILQRFCDTLMR